MERISWDQYFMSQSQLLALRSTCERLAVGATIVREKRVIAGGYNGSVSGSVHCIDEGCKVIDGHCVRTIHAEINAILQCAKFGVPTEGAEIYVTHFPCLNCTKTIIQSGIKKIYYAHDYKNHPYAIELLKESGVEFEQVELDYLHIDTNTKDKMYFISTLLQRLEDKGMDNEELKQLKQEANQLFMNVE
ncbi:ComE operon protein 2 [Tenuibacillus multivorans]|uniref:ComE operon protein 2 n=1 Tax=Tenuibacillus multivorans TaxID=237069 RepID=A0A1G9ZG67_9BACI|nr:ComE operon protein 2 [Tenuibacillus multivorans]GEL78341.1 ComE operon protein 2 [Tenuibacillus multivorans]SDN19991.1 dCMP deaminase [Tenuibacillus multivorans]